jgi:DNA-binding PadR family transcriptional regulator
MKNKGSSPNPTFLDYAILGLLQKQSLSGYRIRKIFETTALGNYSSSPGSIYPALKRLKKLGLINQGERSADPASGPNRFAITPEGIEVLTKWLERPVEEEDISKHMNETMLRFALMEDLISKEQKIGFLKSFIAETREYIKILVANLENESHRMPLHGKLALENGIAIYRNNLRWGRKALKEIMKNRRFTSKINH